MWPERPGPLLTRSGPWQHKAARQPRGSSAPHLPGKKRTCYHKAAGRTASQTWADDWLPQWRHQGARMMIGRRSFLASGTCVIAAAVSEPSLGLRPAFGQDARNLGPNRLVTLGTRGGPPIRTGFTPSPAANLIVFDNVAYVIATGYAAASQLVRS